MFCGINSYIELNPSSEPTKFERFKPVAAIVAGAVANFGFLTPGIFAATLVSLVALFYLWNAATPKHCAFLGFMFGLGLYSVGISWLYVSIHDFGQATPLLAGLLVAILVCFLALFTAFVGYVQAKIRTPMLWRYLLLIPALWVLAEWCRSWIFTGFPWLYVGYSQVDVWLAGWAPLLGVLGVSFATCVIAGAVAFTILGGFRVGVLAFALLFLGVGSVSYYVNWSTPNEKPISAALIQGNITIFEKWNRNLATEHLRFYIEQSRLSETNDLVVWPESTLPYLDNRLEKLKLWELLKIHPSDFLVGVLEIQQHDKEEIIFNSAYAISNEIQKYRKHRLVPFGEFTPFREFLGWILQFVQIPASDLSSYKEPQKPLLLAGQLAGVTICYEDVFPTEILKMLPESTFLINISEDGWFGENLAPYQRLQISRMRAIETARPVLRVANRGISASIDAKGNIIDQLNQGKVLETTIVPATGATPFVRAGNVPILLLCFGITMMIGFKHHRRGIRT